MATVVDIHRPHVPASVGDGIGAEGLADELVVTIDLDADGRRLHKARLKESDYAGLIAEFETGTATTVLQSSIDSYLAGLSDDEVLTSTQAAYLGTVRSWPSP